MTWVANDNEWFHCADIGPYSDSLPWPPEPVAISDHPAWATEVDLVATAAGNVTNPFVQPYGMGYSYQYSETGTAGPASYDRGTSVRPSGTARPSGLRLYVVVWRSDDELPPSEDMPEFTALSVVPPTYGGSGSGGMDVITQYLWSDWQPAIPFVIDSGEMPWGRHGNKTVAQNIEAKTLHEKIPEYYPYNHPLWREPLDIIYGGGGVEWGDQDGGIAVHVSHSNTLPIYPEGYRNATGWRATVSGKVMFHDIGLYKKVRGAPGIPEGWKYDGTEWEFWETDESGPYAFKHPVITYSEASIEIVSKQPARPAQGPSGGWGLGDYYYDTNEQQIVYSVLNPGVYNYPEKVLNPDRRMWEHGPGDATVNGRLVKPVADGMATAVGSISNKSDPASRAPIPVPSSLIPDNEVIGIAVSWGSFESGDVTNLGPPGGMNDATLHSWDGIDSQVRIDATTPRWRYLYPVGEPPKVRILIPMRQRHRDDGLATDAREFKGHGSSQQISNRRGGRTYY